MEKTHGQILIERRLAELDPREESLRHNLSHDRFVGDPIPEGMPALESRELTPEERRFAGHHPALFDE